MVLIVGIMGMCDGTTAATATATFAALWTLWLWLSVIVMVVIAIVLDRRAESVLEDFGQDIFHVYWDITSVL